MERRSNMVNPASHFYVTRAGTFRIQRDERGWMLWLDDDCFDGPFLTAQHALDDLARGHCAFPSCGDPAQFGLPEEIDDWQAGRAR